MKKQLVEKLNILGYTLGSVESLTAGLFASTICSVPGASKVFKGALVTYDSSLKASLCNVSQETINQYGVVSFNTAVEMASNGQKILGTDICVSFTGNAGPSVLEGKPVGRIYIGLCLKGTTTTYEYNLSSLKEDARNDIREQIVNHAIELILKNI